MLTAASLFDLSQFAHARLFAGGDFAWSALNHLKEYMTSLTYPHLNRHLVGDGVPLPRPLVYHNGEFLPCERLQVTYGDATKGQLVVTRGGQILAGASVIMAGAILLGDQIAIGRGVVIESGAMIKSPAVIGDCCEIRQTAYLRGYCLAGERCVLGHATEVKHTVFLNDAKAGHFAYLGDSILGTDVNLGAGTKFANLKMVAGNVVIQHANQRYDTGRRKFGALVGDGSQTGCNSVTNPGTIFGKKCLLMPNATSRPGYYPDRSLVR